MIPPNADRNERIYRLWEKGYTIDQAAAELPDIPRSTIGYYYRKFTQYAKEGRPIAIPQGKQERGKEALESGLIKVGETTRILEMISSGKAEYAYHVLGLFKLMRDLNLFATPEESKALRENMAKAMQDFLNATKAPAQTTPQVSDAASKEGLSLEESIQEARKSTPVFEQFPPPKSNQLQNIAQSFHERSDKKRSPTGG
jgi:hypothetical protein